MNSLFNSKEANDKSVLYVENSGRKEEHEVNFENSDSIIVKREIRKRALEFYKRLRHSENHQAMSIIDSQLAYTTYHYVTYDKIIGYNAILDEPIYDHEEVFQNHYVFNQGYLDEFKKVLNIIAKKHNSFVSLRPTYDEGTEKYYVTGTLYTKKEFEDKFGYPLEDYYEVLAYKDSEDAKSLEEQFRNELSTLKTAYLLYMTEEVEKWDNTDFIEMDTYNAYLYLMYKYEDVPNKEEIVRGMGFVVDDENHTVKLQVREMMLEQKNQSED